MLHRKKDKPVQGIIIGVSEPFGPGLGKNDLYSPRSPNNDPSCTIVPLENDTFTHRTRTFESDGRAYEPTPVDNPDLAYAAITVQTAEQFVDVIASLSAIERNNWYPDQPYPSAAPLQPESTALVPEARVPVSDLAWQYLAVATIGGYPAMLFFRSRW
jgi:hypothetical protein